MFKRISRSFTALFLAVMMVVSSVPVLAADAVASATVSVSVKYGQTEARTMLSKINDLRTVGDARTDNGQIAVWQLDENEKVQVLGSRPTLTYDYGLEALAMQRAAEIAVGYSHTRPNGQTCWTVTAGSVSYSDYGSRGENIAAGYTSAQDVFDGWAERTDSYSYQGHRRNMLSSNFTAVGIGHVYYGGYHFWVQEFGSKTLKTSATTANDSSTTVSVDVKDATFRITSSASKLELEQKSYSLPTFTVTMKTADTWPSSRWNTIVATPALSIADTSIASISGDSITGLKNGTTTLTASYQGATLQIPVTVTAVSCSHTWDNGVTTTAPTCTAAGVKTYTCSKCKETRTESVNALGHSASSTLVGKKDATCKEEGYTGDTVCSRCNVILSAGQTIAKTGHSWDNGKQTKAPTCTEKGESTYTCTVCGSTKTEATNALGHSASSTLVGKKDATCKEEGYTGDTVCSRCNVTLSAGQTIAKTNDHLWDNGVITIPATEDEWGEMTYTCTLCGSTRTEAIETNPLLPNQVTLAKTSITKTASAKKTQTVTVVAEALGGKLTYKSSNKKVKVSSKGVVTIPTNFSGKVTITVTASSAEYEKASAKLTLTVKPTTPSGVKVSSPKKGSIKVKWNKNTTCASYEIQYALKKNFSGKKTVKVKKNTTVSATVSKLKKGKTYYVRIRALDSTGKVASSWSKTLSVKCKK